MTNAALLAARAQLRAVDENVPQALAGWRPTVTLSGIGGGASSLPGSRVSGIPIPKTQFGVGEAQATVTQPIYSGGRTPAAVHQAQNQVAAQRARLLNQEQQTLGDTSRAYVGFIVGQQNLLLAINNEKVLQRQLRTTVDRFRVGDVTTTDVAQAVAAVAAAIGQRETAQSDLQRACATFTKTVGTPPRNDLPSPEPLRIPIATAREVEAIAATHNPAVIETQFAASAADDAVDVAASRLLPQINLQTQASLQRNIEAVGTTLNDRQAVLNLSVPVYQGGAEYSGVRQARQTATQSHRQIEVARQTAQQSAVQAWAALATARSNVASARAQIKANEIAFEGVEREAGQGARTVQDVLNAQQLLLSSQLGLVQALGTVVIASYDLTAAIGRLTARDLGLQVPLYDPLAYARAVGDRWVGTGDYATDQPGR